MTVPDRRSVNILQFSLFHEMGYSRLFVRAGLICIQIQDMLLLSSPDKTATRRTKRLNSVLTQTLSS